MKRRGARMMGICAIFAWFAAGGGAVAGPDGATELDGLISKLASESYPEREKTSGQLLALAHRRPRDVEEALVSAYRHSPDPEIRLRSKRILMTLFAESIGFLGVHFQIREFLNSQGEKQRVVTVTKLVAGSPAETGGLLAGDVILSIDHQAIEAASPDKDFKERIKGLGRGRTVNLSLSRGGVEMDLKVTLGVRPAGLSEREAEEWFAARIRGS